MMMRKSLSVVAQLVGGMVLMVAAGVLIKNAVEVAEQQSLPAGWQMLREAGNVNALAVQGSRLWAGGRDGLILLECHDATRLPVAGALAAIRYVNDLLVSADGSLWVAFSDGLGRLRNGQWHRLAAVDEVLPGPIEALFQGRDGVLWIGGEAGAARWDGQTLRRVALPAWSTLSGVDVIFEDTAGTLWLGSSSPAGGGLLSLSRGKWHAYSSANGLAHDVVNDILQDRHGALWVATGFARSGGASRLVNGAWASMTRADGLAGEKVRSLFEDSTGRLWLGSEYDGVSIFDGKTWHTLTPREGLAGWEVKVMAEDTEGVLWVGTENGLSRIAPAALISWGDKDQ